MSLPDGTPVGTTNGSPTVIPSGYYTVELSQPGCVTVPYFALGGPGVQILDDLDGGELQNDSHQVELLPNSTYSWSSNAAPGTIYTFVTSALVVGAPPTPGAPAGVTTGRGPTNTDPVGSALPHRASAPHLSAAVSPDGVASLRRAGARATRLSPSLYTITVADRSATRGFVLQRPNHQVIVQSGRAFVGVVSVSVRLTPGRWLLNAGPGTASTLLIVG
jgi:hypothetical protein